MEETDKTTPMTEGREGLTTADLAGRGQAQSRPPEPKSFAADDQEAQAFDTPAPQVSEEGKSEPLFSSDEAGDLRRRWDAIQAGFVDQPRKAVEDADGLVAAAIKRLAEIFADERAKLEHEWGGGAGVSTENLRVALRRYRSFFGRLLEV